jgi:hypothetical protein
MKAVPANGPQNWFDLNGADWHPARRNGPRIARELKWINGVRNHGAAEAEVVLRDRVADAIARIIKRLVDCPEISDGLLNRVDAQIHRTEPTSQFPSNRCLSRAR